MFSRNALIVFLSILIGVAVGIILWSQQSATVNAPDMTAPPVTQTAIAQNTAKFPVIVAAGDIACAPEDPGFNQGRGTESRCQMAATAQLVAAVEPTAVLPLGDNQYERGERKNFQASYDPTWGKFNAISKPIPGNHEYYLPQAQDYFDYFGDLAGDRQKGYYSYDLGNWHLVALNSNCEYIGGCDVGSPQQTWLQQDLADHPQACTLAYLHHPRYSSGVHGNQPALQALWQTLYDGGADVVLAGHDHLYERFAPQNAQGELDTERGMRQFVIGTGGKSLYPVKKIRPHSEVRAEGVYGVLRLELQPDRYQWQFLAANAPEFVDEGSTPCQ